MLGIFFVGIFSLLAIDQLTKWIVLEKLPLGDTVALIEGVFHFTHHRNTGAAWGILDGRIWLLAIVTLVVLVAVIYYMVRYRPKNKWLNASLILLTGGALGNFFDRIFRGFVVDFLDFRLINFPIFNVADCFIVVGAVIFAAYMIFCEYQKEKKQ